MTKKFISWLSLMAVFILMLQSCRNDQFPEQETYNNSNKFHLTSKTISLQQAKHQSKLTGQLEKATDQLKQVKTINGKTVDFGNGISIDTDDVIYIENGPGFHTYTFKINRENAPTDAPLENLVLSPLSDGTWKETLVTYHLTEQEKQIMTSGGAVNLEGKITSTVLESGTYSSVSIQKSDGCYWQVDSYYTWCSEGYHNHGELSTEDGGPCKAEAQSVLVLTADLKCPSDGGGTGTGAGPGNPSGGGNPTSGGDPNEPGTGSGGSNPANPCGGVPTQPQTPTTEIGQGDCNGGTPTVPNLGGHPNRKTPCEKTKNLIKKAEIQAKTNILYEQSKQTEKGKKGEKGFMVKPDGTDGAIIPGAEHSVQLGDIAGYQGYYHNHTPAGVKMLSPPDIYKLFQFIVSQPAGTPVDASFGAMVAAQEKCWTCPDHYLYFTYMIRFNGTFQDANTINNTSYDLEKLKEDFEKFEQSLRDKPGYSSQDGNFLSFKGLEEVFFKALDLMKIAKDKIILQRIDKNGNVTNITLGTDGKPQETPCP